MPIGKLTYLGYLIHPILIFLYMYSSPIQQYYYDYFFVSGASPHPAVLTSYRLLYVLSAPALCDDVTPLCCCFQVYLFSAHLLFVHVFSFIMAVAVSAPLMGSIAVFLPGFKKKSRR